MNIRTMKAIDHYAGIPVCLILDLWQRTRMLFVQEHPRQFRRILCIKFFGIGSILLATPMLRAVKSKFPDAAIAFLTFAANREIVERTGLVDSIYALRTDTIRHFVYDLATALWQIRRTKYDAAIDMEFFAKFSTIVAYLSGSPVRIGYFLRQIWRGDLLTEQIYYNHYKHITEVFGALAAPLGVSVNDYSLQPLSVSSEEKRSSEKLLTNEGVAYGELLIGINVNVSPLSPERRWPKERFCELASALLNELNAKIIFIGDSSDSAFVAEIVSHLPHDGRVSDFAGKTGLGELMELLRRCRLFISNDSGPLHIADSVGTATVSFFGPESPMLYGPTKGDAIVFYQGLYCSPCLNVFNVKTAPCKGENICMQEIKTEQVLTMMRSHFRDLWAEFKRVA